MVQHGRFAPRLHQQHREIGSPHLSCLCLHNSWHVPFSCLFRLAGLSPEDNRAYTYYPRSYSYAFRSRLGLTALAQVYLRRFQLMRISDWYLIGALLRVVRLELLLSGCADGPKRHDIYLFTYSTHFPSDLSLRANSRMSTPALSKTLVP